MSGDVLVIGSGKRVREVALPAFRRMGARLTPRAVFARTAKELVVEGATYGVRAFDTLRRDDLAGLSLVYVAVTKDAVPAVLARLCELGVAPLDLLIDTPVVRFKHFRHARKLAAFRRAWVAEDCVYLPWLDPLRAALAAGVIGDPTRVLFDRSAYAYHGLATAKALLGVTRVRRARRRPDADGLHRRTLHFAGGLRADVLEPRDYALGRFEVHGTRGVISDAAGEGRLHLTALTGGGLVRGFQVADHAAQLTDAEAELTAGDADDASLTQRMERMKRVGFLRLLEALADGRGAYPVREALDDMVVDYHLEKAGLYVANPFTSARSPLARGLLGMLSRLGG